MLPIIYWSDINILCDIQFNILLLPPIFTHANLQYSVSAGIKFAGIGFLYILHYSMLIWSVCPRSLEQGTGGLWKGWGSSMWFVSIPAMVIKFAIIITHDKVTSYYLVGPVADKIALYLSLFMFLFMVYTAKDAKEHGQLGKHLLVLVTQEMSDGMDMLAVILDEGEGIPKGLKFTILITVTSFFCLLPLDVRRETAHFRGNDREQLAAVRTLIKVVCVNCVFIAIRLFLWWNYGRHGVIFCLKNAICTIICLRGVYSVFATKQPVREMIQIV